MLRMALISVLLLNWILVDVTDLAGLQTIWGILEKFGVPVLFSILIFKYFSRQVEQRHLEQREFWNANNDYLRRLVLTMQDNYCGYKNHGKEKTGNE